MKSAREFAWSWALGCAACLLLGAVGGVTWERLHQPVFVDNGIIRLNGPQVFQLQNLSSAVTLRSTDDSAVVEATHQERRAALEADAGGTRLSLSNGETDSVVVELTSNGARIHAAAGLKESVLLVPSDGSPPSLSWGALDSSPDHQVCTLGPETVVCTGPNLIP